LVDARFLNNEEGYGSQYNPIIMFEEDIKKTDMTYLNNIFDKYGKNIFNYLSGFYEKEIIGKKNFKKLLKFEMNNSENPEMINDKL